jgi:hypothetical protein
MLLQTLFLIGTVSTSLYSSQSRLTGLVDQCYWQLRFLRVRITRMYAFVPTDYICSTSLLIVKDDESLVPRLCIYIRVLYDFCTIPEQHSESIRLPFA